MLRITVPASRLKPATLYFHVSVAWILLAHARIMEPDWGYISREPSSSHTRARWVLRLAQAAERFSGSPYRWHWRLHETTARRRRRRTGCRRGTYPAPRWVLGVSR